MVGHTELLFKKSYSAFRNYCIVGLKIAFELMAFNSKKLKRFNFKNFIFF